MPFVIPAFPLFVGIYTGPWLTKVFRGNQVCNLGMGRRAYPVPVLGASNTNVDVQGLAAVLLLPAGTDIRDGSTISGYDVVEVPAGTGRWYAVQAVDDVGKGFDNEFRIAVVSKIYENVSSGQYPGLWWPTPIP